MFSKSCFERLLEHLSIVVTESVGVESGAETGRVRITGKIQEF